MIQFSKIYQKNCITLVNLKPFYFKPLTAVIVSLIYTLFKLFQLCLCITAQPYTHHTISHHRHTQTILHHTQAHSHHTKSHHRHIHTILHHATGIPTSYNITTQAYPHNTTSHHGHIDIILHITTGIFTP